MMGLRLAALFALIIAISATAFAGTVHQVRFAQPAQILVWEEGQLVGQGNRIQLAGLPSAATEELRGSGQLEAASGDDRTRRLISIASNTGFSIQSQTLSAQNDVTVRVIEVGQNAEIRNNGMSGRSGMVFQQTGKTAVRAGDPTSQAIALEILWDGPTAPDLFIIAN